MRKWRGACAVTSVAASYFASKSYEAGSVTLLQRRTTVCTDSWRVPSGTAARIAVECHLNVDQAAFFGSGRYLGLYGADWHPSGAVPQFPEDENRNGSRNVGFLAVETLGAAARPRKLSWIQSREKKARGASFHISSPFFVHSCSHIPRCTTWAIDKLSLNSALRLLPLTCWAVCCGLPV